jgi:hypothetical protein
VPAGCGILVAIKQLLLRGSTRVPAVEPCFKGSSLITSSISSAPSALSFQVPAVRWNPPEPERCSQTISMRRNDAPSGLRSSDNVNRAESPGCRVRAAQGGIHGSLRPYRPRLGPDGAARLRVSTPSACPGASGHMAKPAFSTPK